MSVDHSGRAFQCCSMGSRSRILLGVQMIAQVFFCGVSSCVESGLAMGRSAVQGVTPGTVSERSILPELILF
jgi:hypothetical protein